ncbi:hypothetical protein IMCC3317_11150 [Kordia antarctica]|uniref:HTH araC/xylS-type domain-containing protein n=1 Tax=Kordia antarctica TaxID=1218801 RepID=A0A7L4ZH29_9FLAO|nr:AraC family transcriptional regulator [Kordia antarctica]QHI35767.1 hypothetical protein IMCC3317_11150 [Kordia antarctica]
MRTIFLLIIISFNSYLARAQNDTFKIIDSLSLESYEALEEKFYEYEYDDPKQARIYADAYLIKARTAKDSIQMARGYKYISFLYIDSENIPLILKYSDSIIYISKNSNHRSYPALGYNQKGVWLFEQGNYKKALDNYLIAQQYALKHNNINQLKDIKLAIAALRSRYGDYNESLLIYKDYLSFIKNQDNYKKDHSEDYLIGLYNVANGYLRMKNPDSARIYIDKGVKYSIELKDTISYSEFLTSKGIYKYQKKEYEAAIDVFNEAIKYRENYGLAMCFYYKAQSLKELGNIESALMNFKKSDSIYQETNDVFPELRQVYESLIDYEKSINNTQNQLFYIEKLLKVDSVLDSDFKYISENIIKKYDTAILKNDKQNLLEKLSNQKKKSSYIITILIIIGLLIILGSIYFIKYREKLYKRRFDELINQERKVEKSNLTENNTKIADDVTNIILRKLQRFEKEEKFLEPGITLSKVANLLQTNSSYLSKVVNSSMEKSFNTYINDLRIDYVITKLKKDKRFRKYAIKSIAEEIGYANSQSFSNAFSKKTGIKPSYFIKQLNNL